MDKLLQLGFTESANVSYDSELKINISANENATNILYAFVLIDGEDLIDWKVLYIGHTRKTFKNRMYGYLKGHGKAVNNRVHKLIKEYVLNNKLVKVFLFQDMLGLLVRNLHLDLAAGLEYSLINYYVNYNESSNHPVLVNIAGNKNHRIEKKAELEDLLKSEKEEEDQNYDVPDDLDLYTTPKVFSYVLNKTYWNFPYLNIPAKFSDCFGKHGDNAIFNFYKEGQLFKTVSLIINRNAVNNGSPRFYFQGIDGKWFQDWKHKNHQEGDNLKVNIIAKNTLAIDI